jgi:hypothetical protein
VLRPVSYKPFEYQPFPFGPEQSTQHGRNTAVLFPFTSRPSEKTRRHEPAPSPLIAVNPHADVLYLKQDLLGSADCEPYITVISLGVRYGAMRISGRWGITDHKET